MRVRLQTIIQGMIAFVLLMVIPSSMITVQAEEQPLPAISLSTYTVHNGSYAYLTLEAHDFVDVASFEVEIHYNASHLQLISTSYGSMVASVANQSLQSDDPGSIYYNLISLDGLTGNGPLLQLTFLVTTPNPSNEEPLVLAIGEVYNVALEPVSMQTIQGKIVLEGYNEPTVHSMYLYGSSSVTQLQQEETTTLQLRTYYSYEFASGVIEINYDDALFALESVDLNPSLKHAQALYSINDDTAGYVRISYASPVGIYFYDLLSLKLRALQDTDATSNITFHTHSMYDASQNAIEANDVETTLTLVKKETPITYPMISIPDYVGILDNSFTLGVLVEGTTNLAAGDFLVSYDATKMDCLFVEASTDITNQQGLVMINDHYQQGQIRFSFVLEDGLQATSTFVNMVFRAKPAAQLDSVIGIHATGLVNALFEPVLVTFENCSIALTEATETIPGITFLDGSFSYDGEPKNLVLSGDLTDCEVVYENNTRTVPGQQVVTATIRKPNYKTLVLTSTLTITKAQRLIQVDEFTLGIEAKSISIQSDYSNIHVSLDESNFERVDTFGNLNPKTEYQVYLYVGEDEYYEQSNTLEWSCTTYQSLDDLMDKVPTTPSPRDFSIIKELETELIYLKATDQETLQIAIDDWIIRYNAYVDRMQGEYEVASEFSSKLMRVWSTFIVGLMLVLIIGKRGWYHA